MISGDNVKVPVSSLHAPEASRLFRMAEESHVEEIKKGLVASNVTLGGPLICHVPGIDPAVITKDVLENGVYLLEVLGGNHTRVALQQLAEEDARFTSWEVKVYANLCDTQALYLAHEHNRLHELGKHTSFEDYIRFFRVQLEQVLGTGTVPETVDAEKLLEWKRRLVAILALKVCKR